MEMEGAMFGNFSNWGFPSQFGKSGEVQWVGGSTYTRYDT
jgi:hypothetical protein